MGSIKLTIGLLFLCFGISAQTNLEGLGGWRVVAVGHPAESKTNSTTGDQDFTSIYSIPAGSLTNNKMYRVTLSIETIEGVSTAQVFFYVEVGGTKVIENDARDMPNSDQRTASLTFIIQGTQDADASASVEVMFDATAINKNAAQSANTVSQPVTLATTGALTIVPGVNWNATGSTETWILRSFIVETIN